MGDETPRLCLCTVSSYLCDLSDGYTKIRRGYGDIILRSLMTYQGFSHKVAGAHAHVAPPSSFLYSHPLLRKAHDVNGSNYHKTQLHYRIQSSKLTSNYTFKHHQDVFNRCSRKNILLREPAGFDANVCVQVKNISHQTSEKEVRDFFSFW